MDHYRMSSPQTGMSFSPSYVPRTFGLKRVCGRADKRQPGLTRKRPGKLKSADNSRIHSSSESEAALHFLILNYETFKHPSRILKNQLVSLWLCIRTCKHERDSQQRGNSSRGLEHNRAQNLMQGLQRETSSAFSSFRRGWLFRDVSHSGKQLFLGL